MTRNGMRERCRYKSKREHVHSGIIIGRKFSNMFWRTLQMIMDMINFVTIPGIHGNTELVDPTPPIPNPERCVPG